MSSSIFVFLNFVRLARRQLLSVGNPTASGNRNLTATETARTVTTLNGSGNTKRQLQTSRLSRKLTAKDSRKTEQAGAEQQLKNQLFLKVLFRLGRIRQVSFRFAQKLETAFQVRFAASRRPELNLRGRFSKFNLVKN
ncbi:hypothetical protein MmiHf6_14720 [Methanimicrococcus hongohii]|uniref:Uncharacterized protein n=1 Tax=Methanimicrococcus hongohii TaxID=3028295 RepID=A0AA97A2J8_9EURY|nr:hypothetical protein MmiHf6_14720 [Methanimicrococcus sp. Hf6]